MKLGSYYYSEGTQSEGLNFFYCVRKYARFGPEP